MLVSLSSLFQLGEAINNTNKSVFNNIIGVIFYIIGLNPIYSYIGLQKL